VYAATSPVPKRSVPRRGPALSLDYLGKLVDAGLAGVEVYHRENSAEDRARLLKFIEERRAAGTDLLVTGSSDYHGAGKPNLLGENTTDAATVARIREQIAEPNVVGDLAALARRVARARPVAPHGLP